MNSDRKFVVCVCIKIYIHEIKKNDKHSHTSIPYADRSLKTDKSQTNFSILWQERKKNAADNM